jgi:hypothetical protein
MVKQQVNEELIACYIEPILPRDEREAGAKLEQEARDVPGKRVLDVPFLGALGQSEKIENVGILEHVAGEVGLERRQAIGEIGDSTALALLQATLICITSTLRDQPCSIDLAAYHSRALRAPSVCPAR